MTAQRFAEAHPGDSTTRLPLGRDLALLGASIALVAVVSVVGSSATDTGPGSWYSSLNQPSWNPPDWVFAPVWSVLYLAMAVAAWLVARRGVARYRIPLGIYSIQLALNLAWSLVFFGLENAVGAFAVIVVLWAAVAATIAGFWPVDRRSAVLLVPYLAWTTYALALNLAIVVLN